MSDPYVVHLTKPHIEYLTEEFGVKGLIGTFEQDESIDFIVYLRKSLSQHENLIMPDDDGDLDEPHPPHDEDDADEDETLSDLDDIDMGDLDADSEDDDFDEMGDLQEGDFSYSHEPSQEQSSLAELIPITIKKEQTEIAAFAFSVVAYKIVCDSVGQISPNNLMDEIESLRKKPEEDPASIASKEQAELEALNEVKRAVDVFFSEAKVTLEQHKDFYLVKDHIRKIKTHVASGDQVGQSGWGQCCINAHPMMNKKYGEFYRFEGPLITRADLVCPWFDAKNPNMVTAATVALEVSYSYCSMVRRFSLKQGEMATHRLSKDKHGKYWKEVYLLLWRALIKDGMNDAKVVDINDDYTEI